MGNKVAKGSGATAISKVAIYNGHCIFNFKSEMNLQLTDIAEQDWKEYQSVRRPDQYDSEVHTEVEYLEDL